MKVSITKNEDEFLQKWCVDQFYHEFFYQQLPGNKQKYILGAYVIPLYLKNGVKSIWISYKV